MRTGAELHAPRGQGRAWVGSAARTRPRTDTSASLSAAAARLATATPAVMLETHTLA